MTPRRDLLGCWVLTQQCSYCEGEGRSVWQSTLDGREYCPAHLFIAQIKEAWWVAHDVLRDPPAREDMQ